MSATMMRPVDSEYAFDMANYRARRWLAGTNALEKDFSMAFQPAAATSKPGWMTSVEARLNQLANLERDWDKRGSAKPSSDALYYAMTLLREVMRPGVKSPSIIPLGSGALQLVWSSRAMELEVEITRPNEMLVYFSDLKDGTEEEWQEDESLTRLTELVQRIRV